MSYNPNIPTGSVELNTDYQNIQDNFKSLDKIFGVDHVKFSTGVNNGFHTIVHFLQFSGLTVNPSNPKNYPPTVPATIPFTGQLFTCGCNDGYSTDKALFYLNGNGGVTQLTSNFSPADNNLGGYTFLPGGLVIQWGRLKLNSRGSYTNVVFATNNINFANNVLSINLTILYDSNTASPSGTSIYVVPGTESKTGFSISNTSSSSSLTAEWIAIGN